jgi:hypothetical protein
MPPSLINQGPLGKHPAVYFVTGVRLQRSLTGAAALQDDEKYGAAVAEPLRSSFVWMDTDLTHSLCR